MKIALKELLSAAEVDRFKSLGLEASLDEKKKFLLSSMLISS